MKPVRHRLHPPHADLLTVPVAVILALAIAASPARAACGDYLHVATESPNHHAKVPAVPAPAKCLHCSQQPAEAPPESPVTNSTDGRPSALSTERVIVPSHERLGFSRSTSERLPTDVGPASIFHPPR
jgi:hypothetical protein